MAKPITVLKSVGPKLVPFFKTVALYFVLYQDENPSSVFCCLFKCLPIVSLMLFVLLHGMSFSIYYRYSRRILIGLVFSCLGDAFLVWKRAYFMHGLAMFAVAQGSYARAFGWRPFNPYAATVLTALWGFAFSYITADMVTTTGGSGLLLYYMVGVYGLLITTMAWRAVARVQFFDDLWTWTKLCGCAGSILFIISDFVIAVDKFRHPVPHAHTIIMSTYYAAQLLISLSVVDSQADELLTLTQTQTQTQIQAQNNQTTSGGGYPAERQPTHSDDSNSSSSGVGGGESDDSNSSHDNEEEKSNTPHLNEVRDNECNLNEDGNNEGHLNEPHLNEERSNECHLNEDGKTEITTVTKECHNKKLD